MGVFNYCSSLQRENSSSRVSEKSPVRARASSEPPQTIEISVLSGRQRCSYKKLQEPMADIGEMTCLTEPLAVCEKVLIFLKR